MVLDRVENIHQYIHPQAKLYCRKHIDIKIMVKAKAEAKKGV